VQLTIRDLVFPIDRATLHAGMWDPYWSNKWNGGAAPKPMLALELQAAELERDDAMWAPKLYNEWLPFPSRDWRAIANRRIAWTTAFDATTGEPNGSMYVFEHADIHEAELVFGDRTGFDFDISWRGVCDIFWDEGEYGQRVPFAATARARFSQVHVSGSARDDAASFRERFAAHLNPDDFDQGPVLANGGAYDDGMRMTYCVFTPKDA
jgi:hypothetical protein